MSQVSTVVWLVREPTDWDCRGNGYRSERKAATMARTIESSGS
jgi:hypothetical protein